jgi:hypothetical protein
MTASPRVDSFMVAFWALTDEEQLIVRDMVDLAWSRLWAERLAASVPFTI